MVKHAERQKLVRSLSVVAKACGVEGVRDDAGRNAVKQHVQITQRCDKSSCQIWKHYFRWHNPLGRRVPSTMLAQAVDRPRSRPFLIL